MEFFEREMRKLFADEKLINDPQFTGRACLGTLGNGFSVKVQFHDGKIADEFDTLQVKVMNRDGSQVDKISIKLLDVLGRKTVPNNPNFKNGVEPYIWVYRGKAEWYAFRPTAADYKALQSEVGRYLSTFRLLENNRTQSMKMIYICAPLRGDIEKNIEFARQKAQEVFKQGDIPVCPHLMFPPIADATNPQQDEVARNMGLELVKRCNQVNVYGSEWTSGMWAEIKYAEQLGIPVVPEEALNKGPKQAAKNKREPIDSKGERKEMYEKLLSPAGMPDPRPEMELAGHDGNIFAILGRAGRLLKQHGQSKKVEEMNRRVFDSASYNEALGIISEYVHTELSEPIS